MKKLTDHKRYERLLAAVQNGDIDRRSLLRIIGATAAVVGVTGAPLGLLRRQAFAEGVESIRFDGWGGIVSEAFHNNAFPQFTEKTGTKVVEGEFGDTDEFISLVPKMFRDFMLPAYQRVTSYLREMGVKIILVDTDGNLEKLIPLFLESGITGIFPFEVQAGNDIVSIRKRYPHLQIIGGIDKMEVAKGKEAIDKELDLKVPFMLQSGGYIPHIDHLVPPEVSWEDFIYYRIRLREMILEKRAPP